MSLGGWEATIDEPRGRRGNEGSIFCFPNEVVRWSVAQKSPIPPSRLWVAWAAWAAWAACPLMESLGKKLTVLIMYPHLHKENKRE